MNKPEETIYFKSKPEYWNKECLGLKRNTVRKEDKDKRFYMLRKWMVAECDLTIGIKNTKTDEVFYREVTDVSIYDGYFIISW